MKKSRKDIDGELIELLELISEFLELVKNSKSPELQGCINTYCIFFYRNFIENKV